jgi:hypothetical protein
MTCGLDVPQSGVLPLIRWHPTKGATVNPTKRQKQEAAMGSLVWFAGVILIAYGLTSLL